MKYESYLTADGTPRYLEDLVREIRVFAPETIGKHISVQLKAISRIEEFNNGTTPKSLPFSFVEN